MCVQGLVLVVIVIHGVSCVCLRGEFLFLCAGGVHLCLVCMHPVIVRIAEFRIVCSW